jgi:hypothetical protein
LQSGANCSIADAKMKLSPQDDSDIFLIVAPSNKTPILELLGFD